MSESESSEALAVRAPEIGPIRPPSECWSLLVRVTRGCPWNRCAFCPVYKGSRFSIRSAEEVIADIAELGRLAGLLRELSASLGHGGELVAAVRRRIRSDPALPEAAHQVALFLACNGRRAFLQDANSLVMPVEGLARVLEALRRTFPALEHVTSYARAHTLTRRSLEQLSTLRQAGLSRLHVGLESGSDRVLELVRKGVDSARHIEAGARARAAGFELSEYLMPGLGGLALSREHALESARVLSAIDPHYIRLRTVGVVPGTELAELHASGRLEAMDDTQIVAELRLFLEHLEVSSELQSDHELNLLPELQGKLPEDKPRLLSLLDRFLALDPQEQIIFALGRRAGLMGRLADLEQREARARAEALLEEVARQRGDPRAFIQALRLRSL
jgi:radical SAM superfamily enzyme YgiQ (UPF0313 family)